MAPLNRTTAPDASRRLLLRSGTAAAGVMIAPKAWAAPAPLRLRIATDVNAQHILTQTLQGFADALARALPGRFHVELFHSGQIYKDRDLARAVMRGDLDMAAPTLLTLSRITPECGVTCLPAFYGRGITATHAVTDGPLGDRLNRQLQSRLGAHVAGPYLDLGPLDLYFTSRARSQMAAGLKIRIPSGAANVLRLRALGAYPVMMAFSDVPLALSQGTVDALETTAETIRTGQLWDAGVNACVRQEAAQVQYVPLLSGRFWRALSPSEQPIVTTIWRRTAAAARVEAVKRQGEARASCAAHGIVYRLPAPGDAHRVRALLEPREAAMAATLGMDAAFAARAAALAADMRT